VYLNKFGTKWDQSRQSTLNNVFIMPCFIMPCETQHANTTCHNRRLLGYVTKA